MRDLNRHVVSKCAVDWKDIGISLGLKFSTLNSIEKDNPRQSVDRFRKILDEWLKSTPNVTWKTLLVALTNVRGQQLGPDPFDDVYKSSDLYHG